MCTVIAVCPQERTFGNHCCKSFPDFPLKRELREGFRPLSIQNLIVIIVILVKMMILKFVVKEQIKVKIVASIVKKNIIIE